MHDCDATPRDELQLEGLLNQLLGEAPANAGALPEHNALPSELAELRDLARELRAAGRQMGAAASLRVVPARSSIQRGHRGGASAAADGRRHYGAWVAAAAALVLGVFGTGAAAVWSGASPSSPWYGVRLAGENLEVALTPSPLARAEMLIRNAHARVAEIQAMTESGNAGAVRRAADALDADAGWLHAVFQTLPAQQQHELVKMLGRV